MSKRNRALAAVAAALTLALSPVATIAKSEENYALPETEGVYKIAGRPNLKLKVIVQHAVQFGKNKDYRQSGNPFAPKLVCGSTRVLDPDSSAIVDPAGWYLPANWTYRVNTSSVPSTIGAARAGALIGKSYATWQSVLGGSVVFNRGADTTKNAARFDGQNIVTWGRASSGILAVTYIWYDSVSGVAQDIDTIINNRYTWYWSDPAAWTAGQTCAYSGVYDAQNILTHELGHTVGLDDEYTDPYLYNTMYGYGSTGETFSDTLTTGDIVGAKMIYGLAI